MKKKIIIIGAGIGGLMAGNLLAKKGHQVVIFESHSMPGGYIGGFWRKGFYFESGTHSFVMSASIFQAMKDIGIFNKINFVKLKPMRFVSSDFDGIPENYREFKRMLYDAYPDEKVRLDRYFSIMDRMQAIFAGLFSDGFKFTKIFYGLKFALMLMRYKNVTVTKFINEIFLKNSQLSRFMNNNVIYPDQILPISAGGFWFPFNDHWIVKGGMQSWADALAENFIQLGGNLKLKSHVDKIITKDNKAVGVTSLGKVYDADYVISACDYKQTFLKFLDPEVVPTKITEKIRQAEVCQSFVAVYLGLNIHGDEFQRLMRSGVVNFFDVSADLDIRNSMDTNYFDHCKFYLSSPSLENPKLAPDGKSSLMITTVASYNWMNNWGNGDRAKYLKLKNKMCDTLIRRAGKVISNLQELIEFKDAATPLTFESYTQNFEGSTNAWSWIPHKKFYSNSISSNVTSPVKNLLIGSSWATQVGGVPFAIKAGQICAKTIGK